MVTYMHSQNVIPGDLYVKGQVYAEDHIAMGMGGIKVDEGTGVVLQSSENELIQRIESSILLRGLTLTQMVIDIRRQGASPDMRG